MLYKSKNLYKRKNHEKSFKKGKENIQETMNKNPHVCFGVWRERNGCIFYDEELNKHKLKEILIRSIMEWLWRALLGREYASLLDFIINLNHG